MNSFISNYNLKIIILLCSLIIVYFVQLDLINYFNINASLCTNWLAAKL